MSHAVRTAAADTAPTDYDELDGAATAAAAGDRDATARLVALLLPLVTRLCRAEFGRGSGSDDLAAGLCPAVAAAVVAARGPRRAERRGMSPLRVAYEATVQHLQGLRPGASDVLDGISRRGREVLTLRLAVGLSVEQTAVALGITAGRVRVEQHRAVTALRGDAAGTTQGADNSAGSTA
ncbi:sigma factor-like helix-turn-helix DNA-binding protein [Rhodococcus spelaei]|nr:sigma factor-like helix-turn-helix DNA-binding protein [Rhodococcus spelaei]